MRNKILLIFIGVVIINFCSAKELADYDIPTKRNKKQLTAEIL